MKTLVCLLLALSASGACAQSLTLTGPDRSGLFEGETYSITWEAENLKSVSLIAHGTRTPLGKSSRGDFSFTLAEGVPAGEGAAAWTVPWIDSGELSLKLKGFDETGRLAAVEERTYHFRPAVLAGRGEDGIYLDLHSPKRQRLYVQRDGRITRAYLTTSSENYRFRPPGSHAAEPHDHAGVFRVLGKERNHWSTLYDVNMAWAMRYHGGHYIHATTENLYDELGEIASHGCNRLTRTDARELYSMTPIGTRVEVIGPEG